MREPKSIHTNIPKKTLTSLKKDLYKFHMNGGNMRDVKRFHNVIYQSLFGVPIDQVNAFLQIIVNNISLTDRSLATNRVNYLYFIFQMDIW